MCGIAGVFQADAANDPEPTVRDMIAAIRHRGPDQTNTWVGAEGRIAFGHARLSIVDLSPAGAQPMHSASHRFTVVFNGEIYNHRDLRRTLEAEGKAPAWRGTSDTEVLLACIEAWGLDRAIDQAVGMFALALWDHQLRRLQLVRDRFGEKPLYYGWQGRRLLFGSELSALCAVPGFDPEVEAESVRQFLRLSYIPAPWTIYCDTYKVHAGTIIDISAETLTGAGELKGRRYWSAVETAARARRTRDSRPPQDEVAAITAFEDQFRATISDQIVADVPVGAFLSGGIDSTTVVAFMAEVSSQPVRTFSIGFDSKDYNEADFASAVAKHLGTRHTEYRFTEQDLLDIIPKLDRIYDEPFGDSSQLPTVLVSTIARRDVTVALSGDAGDEVFGGYNRYRYAAQIEAIVRRVPRSARMAVSGALQMVPATVLDTVVPKLARLAGRGELGGIVGERVHKLASALRDADPASIYEDLVRRDQGAIAKGLGHRPVVDQDLHGVSSDGRPLVEFMMLMDTVTYLPDDILAKVDRAAMSVSLETRVPFLDHRLYELAWGLPDNLRVNGAVTKQILRKVLAKRVPSHLFERPKSGFGVPIDTWLRGPLKSWAEAILFDRSTLGRYVDEATIRRVWDQHQSGKAAAQHLHWNMIVLALWLKARAGARAAYSIPGNASRRIA